jgi:hypothetical protein
MYGSDSVGTLFDTDLDIWNLNNLPSLLTLLEVEANLERKDKGPHHSSSSFFSLFFSSPSLFIVRSLLFR